MSDLIVIIFALTFGVVILILFIWAMMQTVKSKSLDNSMMSAMMISIIANQQRNQTATASAASTVDAATASVYTPDPPTYAPDPSSYSAPTCTPSDTSSCA